MSIRKDVVKLPLQENAYFLVYHKHLDIGFGPTVLLCVFGKEILKFDCFGKDKGHYHNLNGDRIFFEESTVEEQITKSMQIVTENADKWIPNKQKFSLDTHALLSTIPLIVQQMLQYEVQFYKSMRDAAV